MEDLFASVAENTLVGAAFIFMLYYIVVRFAGSLELISANMNDMSKTLLKIDLRLETLEKRIQNLEEISK